MHQLLANFASLGSRCSLLLWRDQRYESPYQYSPPCPLLLIWPLEHLHRWASCCKLCIMLERERSTESVGFHFSGSTKPSVRVSPLPTTMNKIEGARGVCMPLGSDSQRKRVVPFACIYDILTGSNHVVIVNTFNVAYAWRWLRRRIERRHKLRDVVQCLRIWHEKWAF